MSTSHPGYVDDSGELTYERPDILAQHLDTLKGKRVRVTVKRANTSRTHEQNSWYWGVMLRTAADETGNDLNDIHERLKQLHLEPEVRDILGGKQVKYTTTTLSVGEMSAYLEKCRATLAQFGVQIPECE
jgi:hypothetical protein